MLLTQARLVLTLPAVQAQLVRLDEEGPAIGQRPEHDPRTGVTRYHLAYVMYTSGTTGRPKGVAVEHRGLAALMQWSRETFTEGDLAAVLFSTSVCFDISVFEVFGPLCRGGSVILVEDLLQLADRPPEEPVTFINTVPSALAALLQVGQVPASVKVIGLAGEPLTRGLADRCYRLPGVQAVYNLYGLTEDTVYSTFALVERSAAGAPPIGRPIANTWAYVLDGRLQPVPVGVPGELYLGGDGQARGYLNRPELTAERFVANPFGGPDSRLYRTGDRVRWRPDGMLEYLGRLDRQLKVRGFRVEPGEVETALAKHPGVAEAVVVAREDRPGDLRLVGYVVPPRAEELREYLSGRLPQYMVPSAFVVLDALPLTANGKLDRRALPEPDGKGAVVSGGYTAPRTEVEERLALMWAEDLRLERVGIHDNFFELGGHSLMAIGLFTRIEAAFERSVPLAILFRAQTVSELAAILVEAPDLDPRPRTMTLRTGDSRRLPLFLVHAVSGEHLVWRPLINHLGTDRPVHGLTLPQKNGIPQPFSDIEALAAYHVEQMCAVEPKGPYHIAGYSFGTTVALEIAQQLVAGGREVGLLGAIDSGPFPRYRDGESSLSHLWSFTRNLYYWLIEDFLVTHPREMLARAYRRLKKVAERVRIVPTSPLPSPLPPGFEWLDTERIPSELRRVILTNHQAWMAYKPRPYPGRVTLLRACYGPLFHPLKYDMGWARVALGGLEILTLRGNHSNIMGNHSNIMLDPRVQELADRLRKCLEEADQSSLAPRRSPSLVDIAAVQPKPKNREQLVRAGRG